MERRRVGRRLITAGLAYRYPVEPVELSVCTLYRDRMAEYGSGRSSSWVAAVAAGLLMPSWAYAALVLPSWWSALAGGLCVTSMATSVIVMIVWLRYRRGEEAWRAYRRRRKELQASMGQATPRCERSPLPETASHADSHGREQPN